MVGLKMEKTKNICGIPITVWETELNLNSRNQKASRDESMGGNVAFSEDELSELKLLLCDLGVPSM